MDLTSFARTKPMNHKLNWWVHFFPFHKTHAATFPLVELSMEKLSHNFRVGPVQCVHGLIEVIDYCLFQVYVGYAVSGRS